MIIVDSALEQYHKNGRSIRVGIVGAGYMAKGIIHQIERYVDGISIVSICNRTPENTVNLLHDINISRQTSCTTQQQHDNAIKNGKIAITSDYQLLCDSQLIDVIVESTGHVNYGAAVIKSAIASNKDVVNMNAELDATVGPMLQSLARKCNTILTGCDGDQPATQMNLYRYVKSLGLTPLVCGNIKGLQDRYRNPTTQAGFAKQWGQSATMVTSFADGTKISFEQALVANATGMKVATRGMLGYHHDGHVDDMTDMYDLEMLNEVGGIVDYVVGPKPGPGVFVFASCENDKTIAHYLNYGKLGKGPLYSFYTPYHLTVLEVQHSIARVALFRDNVVTPQRGPVVDVITAAKTDMQAGKIIDGLGGYDTFGLCENYDMAVLQNLLPIGIAEGAVLKRPVKKDQVLTYDDVELPTDHLAVRLRLEQNKLFPCEGS